MIGNISITIFRELRKLNCPRLCVLKMIDDREGEEEIYLSGIDIRLRDLSELDAEWLEHPVDLWSCCHDKSWLAKLQSLPFCRERLSSYGFSVSETLNHQDSLFKALARRIEDPWSYASIAIMPIVPVPKMDFLLSSVGIPTLKKVEAWALFDCCHKINPNSPHEAPQLTRDPIIQSSLIVCLFY